MKMVNFVLNLDRQKLVRDLEILKPVSGSDLKRIFDFVRFTVIGKEDLNSADLFIYGTNGQNYTCVFHGPISIEGIEKGGEYSVLLDFEKLLKICKSSNLAKIIIKEIDREERDSEGNIKRYSRYQIVTEGKSTISSLDVEDFPNEDLSDYEEIVSYSTKLFSDIWLKASIAKGEFDIKRTCIHFDGNFMTLDQSFASIVLVAEQLKPKIDCKFSINLETGVGDVLKKINGKVVISKSKSNNRVLLACPEDGVFISIIPIQSPSIPYKKVLDSFPFSGKCILKRESFASALSRAVAFVDKKSTNAIKINIYEESSLWYLKISTIEDMSSQMFEEIIPAIECNAPLTSSYNSLNLIKAVDATENEKIVFSWRTEGIDKNDRTVLIKEENSDFSLNVIIPHMATRG